MNTSEQYRAECEARYWLSRGYKTPTMVEKLKDDISAKRGKKAADYLIENMRKVYRGQI